MWLDGSAWDGVVPELVALGHHPVPLTFPGQGDGAASATLDDQLGVALAAVDAAPGKPLVVGHSAASTLAWLAADARPERVAKVPLIAGFPAADGRAYADHFAIEGGAVLFPGWEPFESADAADLDQQARDRFASTAIPVPEAVTREVVRLTNEGRFDVPVVVVCPEFTPAQAKEWIAAGESPELARATHLQYVDLDSGHWPTTTRPRELARVLSEAANS
ncbi:alpha/beta fold hydrolase [Streptomyces sp. AC555_RSS877]|uniref:alpha/beta fold hydrolase n=1 Tax=Streptomyces sp. AC555_RSS877 TaxID=2823688 RepID=UPI0020B858F7|nr:alpha/beta hydrolase [Streptomyces sp. AC555_RSS877]